MVTCDMSISVDGFAAGPNQSADKPFGNVDAASVRWTSSSSARSAAPISSRTCATGSCTSR